MTDDERAALADILDKFEEYVHSRHNANIGWWNDNYAFRTIEDVIKPARKALRVSLPGRLDCGNLKLIEAIIYENSTISHFGRESEVDNAAYLAREIVKVVLPPTLNSGAVTREELLDRNWKDAKEFCEGAFGPFVADVSQYTKIVAELMEHATNRAALSPNKDDVK